ncbi:iron ABC transporter permease [Pararhodobacter sp. CCB-MM2]|uniref:FecCD family ABC transporter permease n=1 Tax=Pararhodobacter sp. CCB-MM2 TaxID=1786003 RepID=UPI0008351E6A|nr:iron ABC transporter permease [Pararhodobacter sp. CCB-MM2]
MRRGLDGHRRLGTVRVIDLSAGLGLTVAALVLALASVTLGHQSLPLSALLGPLSDDQSFALWEVRLPRVVMGAMAGFAVALSGALLQGMVRNPLADPGLLGLSQGAMLVLLLCLVLAPGLPAGWITPMAVCGGMAVAGLLMALAGRAEGLGLLLLGLGMESTLSSAATILMLYAPPEASTMLAQWMAGSLFRASWDSIATFGPWAALALPALVMLGPGLSVLVLGDERAATLGLPVPLLRLGVMLAAVSLSAAALQWVGPLAFLGVMAPNLAGAMTGASGRARLTLAGLTGSVLVLGADVLSRGLEPGLVMSIGLTLSVVGVPAFLILLRLRQFAAARS